MEDERVVLTYVYYRWVETENNCVFPDPERYMKALHEMVNRGVFQYITYAGQLNTNCAGADRHGPHYGFIIVANKKITDKIINMIDYDIVEHFDNKSMEKLNHKMETFSERIEKYYSNVG